MEMNEWELDEILYVLSTHASIMENFSAGMSLRNPDHPHHDDYTRALRLWDQITARKMNKKSEIAITTRDMGFLIRDALSFDGREVERVDAEGGAEPSGVCVTHVDISAPETPRIYLSNRQCFELSLRGA